MVSSAATAAAGIASKNPAMAISGGIVFFESILSMGVISDVKKYEEAIRDLAGAFSVLQTQMEGAIGKDKIGNMQAQIQSLNERIKQHRNATFWYRTGNVLLGGALDFFGGRRRFRPNWENIKKHNQSIKELEELIERVEKQKKRALHRH